MLKLSKKVDYGLMSLMHLAQRTERSSWSAREISENYDIPLELLAKILQKLVQKGLLVSHAGTHGGYSLSRPAGKISAAEVIEAIEGPLSLTNCVSDDGVCGQFEKCNVKSPLQRLNEIVAQTFRDLTIEEMSRQQSVDFRTSQLVEPRLVSISTLSSTVLGES
jgi:Rrf2 family protein